MVSYAAALAARYARPVVVVTIEGLGQYSGLWRFVAPRIPGYGTARDRVRAVEWPALSSEEISPLGGVMFSSELTIELLDSGDELTAQIRTDQRAQTRLSGAAAIGATTLTFVSATGIVAGSSVVYVGNEAILVDSLSSGTTYNVTRGALGTQAQLHRAGAPVYLYLPGLYGRRMRVYLGFDDPGFTLISEQQIGSGWLTDRIQFGRGLSTWILRGRSQVAYLDRLVLRRPWTGYVAAVNGAGIFDLHGTPGADPASVGAHFADRLFFEIDGKEIVRLALTSNFVAERLELEARGVGGTSSDEIATNAVVRQVYVADPVGGWGSFRYQDPGAETSSRSTGTWQATDHPVPIMLALLTSASDFDDETPDNYRVGAGNYSALPGGVGLGFPEDQIAWDTWLDVWYRTQNFRLTYFVLREASQARDLFDKICRLCGFDLRTADGDLQLDMYRSPPAGSEVATWDDSVILTEERNPGVRTPILEAELDTSITAGAVIFKTKTSRGTEVQSIFTDANFREFFGDAQGLYNHEERRVELDAEWIRSDIQGTEPEIIKSRALQLLSNYRRPPLRIQTRTDLSQERVQIGEVVALTHAQLPNFVAGVRGQTGALCRTTRKRVSIRPGATYIDWDLILYSQLGRRGRICPSARIASVSVNTATVTQNRYSDPSARLGLPQSDGLSFAVGDRVRMVSRAGVPVATTPTYQTVQSRTATTLVLDGNFGGDGAFAAGTVLEYIGRDGQVAAQYNAFVSMADDSARTVGSSTQTPWGYSEP